MGRKLIVLSIAVFIGFFFFACTKKADGITGPAGPAGENGLPATDTRSAITGYVTLVNQFNAPESAVDSVLVMTWMGDSLLKTLTGQTGFFKLAGLKSGEYRILFAKKLYDSMAVNIKHSAGNEDQFINSIKVTGSLTSHFTNQIFDLQVSPFNPAYNIATITNYFDGLLTSQTIVRYVEYYFSGSPDVSRSKFVYSGEGNSSGVGYQYMVNYIGFEGSDINDIHFNTGDTVYMKTYFVPVPGVRTSWFDTKSYQNIAYPYVGDSISNYFLWKN